MDIRTLKQSSFFVFFLQYSCDTGSQNRLISGLVMDTMIQLSH